MAIRQNIRSYPMAITTFKINNVDLIGKKYGVHNLKIYRESCYKCLIIYLLKVS